MTGNSFTNFHVGDEGESHTVAAALRRFLPDRSWNEVRRLIRNRHVQLNGNLCVDEARRIRPGDVLKVWSEPVAAPVREEDIRIPYLDRDVIIVEKPAGITSVRHSEEQDWTASRRQFQPTLDELAPKVLQRMLGQSRPKGERGKRPKLPMVRAVHRLDRDTSGLMVFARNVEAERSLVRQFAQHTIHRAYLAVVAGHVEAQTIETQLVRDRGDGRRGSSKTEEGVRAVTHVRPIENLPEHTLIECRLETGRTHQIRIHLSELGHPVCGDKVYRRAASGKVIPDTSRATRQALHAAELAFQHPTTGEVLEFRMPMPADIAALLNRLRNR